MLWCRYFMAVSIGSIKVIRSTHTVSAVDVAALGR